MCIGRLFANACDDAAQSEMDSEGPVQGGLNDEKTGVVETR
jgi:hypothetical protein